MDPSNFIETIETSPSVGQHFPTGGSFYTGAHGFRIDKQTNVVNTYAEPNDLLSVLNPIPDASFARDRTLSPPDSNCLPGTRQALIKNIQSWLDSSTLRGLQHVMWIYGYVGCGKSSISQTLAENKTRRFAATVASQLAAAIPATVPHLQQAVRTHAGLLTTFPLSAQFEHLVYRPLKAFLALNPLKPSFLRDPYIIILDGLDECDDREEISAFIEHLLRFFDKNPRIPLKFLITSRVEEHLRSRLDSGQVHFLNLVDHTSLDDVAAVVDATFALASKHDRVIQAYGSWPSPADRNTLVEHSGGSLIFMSAMLKFILGSSMDGLTPMERLPLALNINPGLDGLYAQTLSRSENIPHFSNIITAIVISPTPSLTISELAKFLGIHTFEVVRVLVNLHAILQVPGDNNTPVTICHSSLRDFLEDESRSQRFHVSADWKRNLYKRFLASLEPTVMTLLAAVSLLFEPLSIVDLADLLEVTPGPSIRNLNNSCLIFKDTVGLFAHALSPLSLQPAFREFLDIEISIDDSLCDHQQLAYRCFTLMARSQHGTRFPTVERYARCHAMKHWDNFLETAPPGAENFRLLLGRTIEHLQQHPLTLEHATLDAVLTLFLTMEVATFAVQARISLDLLAGYLGVRAYEVHMIAEVIGSLIQRSRRDSLRSLKPDIAEDIRDMNYKSMVAVARTHLTLLSIRQREISEYPVILHSGHREALNSRGNTLARRADGSPIFISEFTKFIAAFRDWRGRTSLPPLLVTIDNALESQIPLGNLYARLFSYSHYSNPSLLTLISTISSLERPFTVFELSLFFNVSTLDIRSVLGKMRGIISLPSDDSTGIVLPTAFMRFLQNPKRAGIFYPASLFHMQLAERCLRVWVESDTDSEQAVMLRDYCQTHWRTHWEAAHPNGPDEERKWPTNEAVFIVRLLIDLCSHSTVEVVLRLVLEKGLADVVQILSSRNTDQWELAISALGYTHDTPGMDKRLLLICAQVLLAFHRLRDWGGFLLTQADLVYGPIAGVLHSTTP